MICKQSYHSLGSRWRSRPVARIAGLLGMIVVLPVLAACGGGGGSAFLTGGPQAGGPQAGGVGSGRLLLTVKWPSSGKLIPAASTAIGVVLTAAGSSTPLGHQLLVRPHSAPWTTSFAFGSLQPGSVTLTATAYPNQDGSGVAQATGSQPAVITAGNQTTVTINMASTIDHITVTPANPTLNVGLPLQLHATAYNAQGEIVLTSVANVSWKSGTPAFATIDGNGIASAVSAGKTTITATESESKKSGSTTLTVTAPLVAPDTFPSVAVVDRSSHFLYVGDGASKQISAFQIGSDGTLTPLATPTIPLAAVPNALTVDPAPGSHYLYVAAEDYVRGGTIFQYSINANGSLTPLNPGSFAGPSNPQMLVCDSAGKNLYALDSTNGIRPYKINKDGTLTQNGPDASGGGTIEASEAISSDGKWLLVVPISGQGVRIDSINPDGTLAYNGTAPLYDANSIATSPTAPFAYLMNPTGPEVLGIGNTGALTPLGNARFASNCYRSVVSPNGKNLYVVSTGVPNNVVAQYTINGDGTLTPLSPATVPAGNDTMGVAISPDGKWLYVINSIDNTVSQYRINGDGSLTPLSPPAVPG